jgi:hypothetical protein
MSGKRMEKSSSVGAEPDMRAEYDFRGGVRGKYVNRGKEDVKMVVLDPDVARAFKSPSAVNRALRAYLSQRAAGKKRSGTK